MPPRRPTHGRHRRPKNTVAPAYFTVATVAAFAVSGLNVPSAIGAATDGGTATAQRSGNQASSVRAAAMLRDPRRAPGHGSASAGCALIATRRCSAAQEAARRARLAAEQARPRWVLPIVGYHLTAGFGEYGLWSHAHTGQDFAAPSGTPVHARSATARSSSRPTTAPTATRSSSSTPAAWSPGTPTCRPSRSASATRSQAGQLIGRVGSTGNTTGPHLHLEIRPHNDIPVDPLPWLRAHGIKY